MNGSLPAEETIALAVEAISDGAPERLRPLLAPHAKVATDRGVHEGHEAVLAWSAKGYEHLDRRYAIDGIEGDGRRFLVRARVEYVWRESGELGDSSPAWLAVELERGRIVALSLHDERAAAEDALRA